MKIFVLMLSLISLEEQEIDENHPQVLLFIPLCDTNFKNIC